MYEHTSVEQMSRQKKNREKLIQEGVKGITKKDILPNTSFPLYGESEAMYFKRLRDFLKTSLAKTIMDINKDIYIGEIK